MMHKKYQLLLMTALAFPMQDMSAGKVKKVRCLKVKRNASICGNLSVGGILTLDGIPLNNLLGLAAAIGATGATGAPGATGLSTLVSSIIPFSSGLITLGTAPFTTGIPATGLVMADGSSNVQSIVSTSLATNSSTAYAFTVPAAGTLHDLSVSVDSVYAIGAPSTPFTFTFTILVSPCTPGAVTPYTATALTATASTTAPAAPITVLTAGGAGCGSSAVSIPVAAGDRVVLFVTPSAAIPAATVSTLSLSAGVLYSPAS